METGSSGRTSSQLDASQFQALAPAWYQGYGEEAHLGFPDWHLLRHQLGRWGEHIQSYLHLAILIHSEMSSRQIPTHVPHPRKTPITAHFCEGDKP